jgi:hypothetical protein
VTNEAAGVVYKYDADGDTPSVVETLTAACTQLFTDGTTLYAAQGASNVARTTTDGTTWASAAYNANCFAQRDENVLCYGYGATLVPGTGYADTIAIGWSSTTMTSMVYFQNALWIGKPEGLYRFQYGRVSEVFPVAEQYNTTKVCCISTCRPIYFSRTATASLSICSPTTRTDSPQSTVSTPRSDRS